jgi:hypothetical protein
MVFAMNRHAGHPRDCIAPSPASYGASLRSEMNRIARAMAAIVSPIAGELRRLNRIGADAGSRGERVRIVKRALARRGEGPNRCC